MYKEMITTIKDVKVGDKVMGTDGKWYNVIDILPPFMPKSMYKLVTENGYVECSGDHLFCIWVDGIRMGNFSADSIYCLQETFNKSNLRIGKEDGPLLIDIQQIEPKLSCCIVVDSPDQQFEIILENE